MVVIGLSKQQALDADPRAIQQINFTVNLDTAENTIMFLIIEKAKETVHKKLQIFLYNAIKKFNFYLHKMTQYNNLKVKLSNSQLNKLKSAIKNETEVV